jgi:hypothetical protein
MGIGISDVDIILRSGKAAGHRQKRHGHSQGEHHHQVNTVQHVDPRHVVLVDKMAPVHTRAYILCRQGHTGLSHRSDKIRLGSSLQ